MGGKKTTKNRKIQSGRTQNFNGRTAVPGVGGDEGRKRKKRAEIRESSSGRAVTLIQTAISGKSLTQSEWRLHPGQPLLQPGGVVVGKHAGSTHTHRGEMLQREMSGPTWSDGAREQTHSIKGGEMEREGGAEWEEGGGNRLGK